LSVFTYGFLLSSFVCAWQTLSDQNELRQDFPPNDHDLYVLLAKPENFAKTADLFVEVINIQNPLISQENLLKLVEARQKSIDNFRCRYTVYTEMIGENLNSDANKITYEFACSKNKLYFAYEPNNIAGTNDPSKKIAYDGEKILSLLCYNNGQLHAGIEKPDAGSLLDFFQSQMPLTLAMLFDTNFLEIDMYFSNLMSFLRKERLYAIYEKMETIDGHDCVVVADLTMRIYLDPKKDFSVVQSDVYRQEFSDGNLVGRLLLSRSKLFNLTNYGNSIWLPSKIVIENFDEFEKVIVRHIVDVSFIEVNRGIDDKYFTNFIPDDTFVADTMKDMVYIYGDHASIGGLLKDVIKSKRVMIFRYISVCIGLVLILLAVVMKYRVYLINKSST